MGYNIEYPSTKNLEERIGRAKDAAAGLGLDGFHVLVDGMDNAFNEWASAWPMMYFVMQHGKVAYIGDDEDGQASYDVARLFGVVRRLSLQGCKKPAC